MNHLSEETINEYLDHALTPELRAKSELHLAACPTCAARLGELRALFGHLASLPELALEVDLASQFKKNPAPLPPSIRWLTLVEALIALFALVLFWPLAETTLPSVPIPTTMGFWPDGNPLFADGFILNLDLQLPRLGLDLPVAALALTVISATLLWLLGNGLLLSPRSRRIL